MVVVLFLAASLVILELVFMADYVKNRFRHSRQSRLVLALQAPFALLVGIFTSARFWPELAPGIREGVSVLIGLPVYALMAFATVEFWRRRKQGWVDREISRLLRERDRWEETLERLNWELADLERERDSHDDEAEHFKARLRALEDQVSAWEEEEAGLKRMIRVEQWTAEMSSRQTQQLGALKDEVMARLEKTVPSERQELIVQLQLLDMILLRRRLSDPRQAAGGIEHRLSQLMSTREQVDSRLSQIREELQFWQERKSAFLRERIPLD